MKKLLLNHSFEIKRINNTDDFVKKKQTTV